MTAFMQAARDSRTCIRRQQMFYGFSEESIHLCDALEDKNIVAFIPPSNKTRQNFTSESVLLIAVRVSDELSLIVYIFDI
jgi:hypothetical protein